jgi:hypothetical protein
MPALPSHWQVDLIDLGAGRDPSHRYIMSYVDLFTRHVWLRALPTKEPRGVAEEVGAHRALPGQAMLAW